jgi:hypothetical protein
MRTVLLAVLTAGWLAVGAADALANAGPPRPRTTTKTTAATARSKSLGDRTAAGGAGGVVAGMAAALAVGLFGAWLLRRGETRQG